MTRTGFKLLTLLLVIVLAFAMPSAGLGASGVVSPNGSYCLDETGVMSEETKAFIEERNRSLEQFCRGAQMCAVVIDSTHGVSPENYAYDVFTSWRIGRSGEDNGVLILMLIEDDNYWIMRGTGLEEVLSAGMLQSVIDVYTEPSFAAKDYDTALYKTFDRLNDELCGYYRVSPSATASPSLAQSGFVGGGGSTGSVGSDQFLSCNTDQFHYSRPSCTGCGSCALACISCGACGSCGSCTGIGGIVLAVIVVYILLQVLRYIGRGSVSRVSGPRGFRFGPTFGGRRGPSFRPRSGGHTGFNGGGRTGFSGGGGTTRGGGAGRSGFGGFSGSRGGFSGGSRGGFSGGGGGTRGGGAGRR